MRTRTSVSFVCTLLLIAAAPQTTVAQEAEVTDVPIQAATADEVNPREKALLDSLDEIESVRFTEEFAWIQFRERGEVEFPRDGFRIKDRRAESERLEELRKDKSNGLSPSDRKALAEDRKAAREELRSGQALTAGSVVSVRIEYEDEQPVRLQLELFDSREQAMDLLRAKNAKRVAAAKRRAEAEDPSPP